MSSVSKDTISAFTRIDQLKGDNWVPWKSRVTALFRLADLHGLIDRTDKRPESADTANPTSAEATTMATWDTKDGQIQSLLQLAVSGTELVHLMGAHTAHQMWEQLREVKEPWGILGILSARRRLFRLVAQEGAPMIDHIAKFRKAQEALHAMGEPLVDRDFVMILVTSLPESWDTFTSSYLNSEPRTMTLIHKEQYHVVINDIYHQYYSRSNFLKDISPLGIAASA